MTRFAPRLLAWSAAALALALAGPAHAEGTDLTGRMAPEIHVTYGIHGLASGASLAALRGKVVVLKFFFVGCPVCRDSMPAFQDLYARYAPRGVQFIGIDYDDRASGQGYLDSHGYTFPVGIDPEGITSSRYGVRTYPTDYVVGADGVVKAYNSLSTGVIEGELLAARARMNVEELGVVPPALRAAQDAARGNDYGEVLRIVEAHLDRTKDPADVVAAAARIQAIAKGRYERRTNRLRARWDGGDRAGALGEAQAIARDFAGTSLAAAAESLARGYQQRLSSPAVAPR